MRRFLLLLVCALVCSLVGALGACRPKEPPPDAAAAPAPAAKDDPQLTGLCADLTQPQDQLCSYMPHDAHSQLNGYAGFSEEGQIPFDNFSWQSFVAVNWPANPDGTPSNLPFNSDPSLPRVWDYFKSAEQVFPPVGQPDPNYPSPPPVPPACLTVGKPLEGVQRYLAHHQVQLSKGGVIDDPDFFEEAAVNLPLIDRNLNFTVYELLVNKDEFEYVYTNGLWSKSGQQGKTIQLPMGSYQDATTQTGGPVGAVEIKASWRVLDPAKDDVSRYFTRQGRIYVPASASEDNQEFCTPMVTLGLVGMHIIHNITSEPNLTWSTFEHVDNAPDTPTAASDPGCALPASVSQTYSFYNPQCQSGGQPCAPNGPPQPIGGRYYWSKTPPYAQDFATGGTYGTQVVRCTPVYAEADEITAKYQAKMAGTPFQYYRLVGTQWGTKIDAPPFNVVSLPTYLANTTAETYLQKGTTQKFGESSCIGCHSGAQDAAGASSDFSFLFSRAK